MRFNKVWHAAFAVAGLALGATSANAAGSITGSVSLIGFYGNVFAAGSTSIVSQLTHIIPSATLPVLVGAGFGDYASSNGLGTAQTIILDPMLPGYPGVQPAYTFLADSTQFHTESVLSIQRLPLLCIGNICSDSMEFRLLGTVKRAGFDDTHGLLIWTSQGTCVGGVIGGVATCTSTPSPSWSASLSSPARVPEPATLGLLGLGLLGVAAGRRRSAARAHQGS